MLDTDLGRAIIVNTRFEGIIMHVRALTLATTVLATAQMAAAQDADGLSVGAVIMSSNSIYAGADSVARVYPNVSYKSGPLEIGLADGIKYSFDNILAEPVTINLRPNFGPYSDDDSAELAGMKRDMTADIVIGTKFELMRGTHINVKLGTEVTGKFNGHMADVSLSQFIPLFGKPVVIQGGARLYDSKRSNYFYGVYAAEQTNTRAAYSMDTTVTPYLSASTFFSITERTDGFIRFNMDFTPDNVLNSPIVTRKTNASVLAGIAYRF